MRRRQFVGLLGGGAGHGLGINVPSSLLVRADEVIE
jgi:hypothetical protein